MGLKIAINGFGRIGRSVARVILARDDVELVAINDLAPIETLAYLLQNDSVHGGWNETVMIEGDHLRIGSATLAVLSVPDPRDLDFASYGAQVVLECSGRFLTRESTQHHIAKGITKVIFSAPTQDLSVPTYVLGVNADMYRGEAIFSNASCTTNCLGPIAKLLDTHYGIDKGLMTTIHAYTNDQNLLDVAHPKDRRRSRAAALNMIPTTTGAAKALSLVLPQLEGRLHGQSVRVPTPDVSMVDLTLLIRTPTTATALTSLFAQAEEGPLRGILHVDRGYRVSQDFVGSPYSAIVAEDLIQVMDQTLIKVMAWYDNEWGYSNRLVEMALYSMTILQ